MQTLETKPVLLNIADLKLRVTPIPVVPDFVIELRSKSDPLKDVRAKMEEYRRVGVRLGWLINPQQQQVEIYRLGHEVEILEAPVTLSGEDVLPGFILDLRSIF
jgi:Uma2 family endonuclease